MNIVVSKSVKEMGRCAAGDAAARLRTAIAERGEANLVVATGASQFEVLAALVAAEGIDWLRVTGFHLDEYLGLPMSHPASFRRYLKERLVDQVPFRAFHYIDGEADPASECRRVGELIRRHPIDVAMVGIGENGHLAFNDPPADFETNEPYIVVALDDACRRQQFGEGWFPTFDAVPTRAISMSIRQIMRSRAIICSVPDQRKAEAVRAALEGPVTPHLPASVLQQHSGATTYLDPPAASAMTNVEGRMSSE
jgi:glucosamine-6-phosphate deaminase